MHCITGVAFQAGRTESRVIYPKHEFRTENFSTLILLITRVAVFAVFTVSCLVFRWATEARDGMEAVAPTLCRASDAGSADNLRFIVGQMAKGRVRQALSASMMAQTSPLHSRSASLDSLVSFAASPVLLDELEARMGTHDLRAKVTMPLSRFLDTCQPRVALRHVMCAPPSCWSSAGRFSDTTCRFFLCDFVFPHRCARLAFGLFITCCTK